jgi:hypothetical protein
MSGCGLPGERRLSDVALCLAVIESAESLSEPPRARGPRGCVARDTGLGFLSAPMRTGRLVRNHRLPPERHRGRTPMRMPEPGPPERDGGPRRADERKIERFGIFIMEIFSILVYDPSPSPPEVVGGGP